MNEPMEYRQEYLMNLNEEEIEALYCMQYNEILNIPCIDKVREEGIIVYKLFIFGNHHAYLCRVFDDKDYLSDEMSESEYLAMD